MATELSSWCSACRWQLNFNKINLVYSFKYNMFCNRNNYTQLAKLIFSRHFLRHHSNWVTLLAHTSWSLNFIKTELYEKFQHNCTFFRKNLMFTFHHFCFCTRYRNFFVAHLLYRAQMNKCFLWCLSGKKPRKNSCSRIKTKRELR